MKLSTIYMGYNNGNKNNGDFTPRYFYNKNISVIIKTPTSIIIMF